MRTTPSNILPKQPLVLLDGIPVGHAGQIIADRARPAILAGTIAAHLADLARMLHEIAEQFFQHLDGPAVGLVDFRTVVKVLVEITAQLKVFLPQACAVADERLRLSADLVSRLYARGEDCR